MALLYHHFENGCFMADLSERLNLSADQQKYIDNSEPGEGLLIFENVVLPFSNPIPKNTQLYKIMTTRLSEVVEL